jgi:hypothetical protein
MRLPLQLGTKSSSTLPSQSSSIASQLASVGAGAPGVQLSTTSPRTQLVAPLALQAPVPQLVVTGTKSSSTIPSQSSSIRLQF